MFVMASVTQEHRKRWIIMCVWLLQVSWAITSTEQGQFLLRSTQASGKTLKLFSKQMLEPWLWPPLLLQADVWVKATLGKTLHWTLWDGWGAVGFPRWVRNSELPCATMTVLCFKINCWYFDTVYVKTCLWPWKWRAYAKLCHCMQDTGHCILLTESYGHLSTSNW